MFVNPKLIDSDTLISLAKDWLSRRADFDSSYCVDANMAEQVVNALKNKELVICFSDDDELEDEQRLDIRPCAEFGLTPSKVQFD
ncbi:hypothetical protein [Algibacillus agarilyticus]|uniref:hypothetical protein n=1 Tax=Algibacillus agarilyticus TaxID=2234133 RepID=UPI000DCFA02A|nr:hypothetical protein [Algibacillus agarilyticus]